MGKHQHRIDQASIDPDARTGTCKGCGPDSPVRMHHQRLTWFCRAGQASHRLKWDRAHRGNKVISLLARKEQAADYARIYYRTYVRPNSYQSRKGTSCEMCGFVADSRCQLDVNHIDANHKNNDPQNLETLCANCHRLVTMVQGYRTKRRAA